MAKIFYIPRVRKQELKVVSTQIGTNVENLRMSKENTLSSRCLKALQASFSNIIGRVTLFYVHVIIVFERLRFFCFKIDNRLLGIHLHLCRFINMVDNYYV